MQPARLFRSHTTTLELVFPLASGVSWCSDLKVYFEDGCPQRPDWREMVNQIPNGVAMVSGGVAVVCMIAVVCAEVVLIAAGVSMAASAVAIITSDETTSCLSGHGSCPQAIISAAIGASAGKFGMGAKAAKGLTGLGIIGFRSDTSHIFRNAAGHLAEDTAENRALIQSALDPQNLYRTTTVAGRAATRPGAWTIAFTRTSSRTDATAGVTGAAQVAGHVDVVVLDDRGDVTGFDFTSLDYVATLWTRRKFEPNREHALELLADNLYHLQCDEGGGALSAGRGEWQDAG
ncbi:UNVERIFIED_ORG: hypothetical protein ABIB52_002174 [Arthrobacter sp. UYCu721]